MAERARCGPCRPGHPLPPKSLLAPAASFSPFPSSRCPPQRQASHQPRTLLLAWQHSPPARVFLHDQENRSASFLGSTILFLKSRLSHTFPFFTLLLLHSLFPDLPPSFSFQTLLCFLPCRHRLPSASPTCRSLIHLVPLDQPNRPGRTSIQPTISASPGSCSGCGIVQQEQLRIGIRPVEQRKTRRQEKEKAIPCKDSCLHAFLQPLQSIARHLLFWIRIAQPPQRNIHTHDATA